MVVPISIYRQGRARYQVVVSPPEGEHWRSNDPVSAWEVMQRLSRLGCHSTDIADALYAADPLWAEQYDRDVLAHSQSDAD